MKPKSLAASYFPSMCGRKSGIDRRQKSTEGQLSLNSFSRIKEDKFTSDQVY